MSISFSSPVSRDGRLRGTGVTAVLGPTNTGKTHLAIERMLVIHPDECIDCGVCEPECPVEAIKPDTEPGLEKWLELNAEFAKTWPNITVKKEPPPDHKEWEGKPDKAKLFDPEPGTGD